VGTLPQAMGPLQDIERLFGGPGTLRFVVQPLVAMLLGLRDGRRDAAAGHVPFVLALIAPDRATRVEARRSSIHEVWLPFCVAFILDALLQHYVLGRVVLLDSVVVGVLLVAMPYSLLRGVSERLHVWRSHRHP
jgi:hypothetical protein